MNKQLKRETVMNDELKEWFETWMLRFMERFDRLEKFMEVMSGRYNMLDGVRLLDNQDLCQMLNVSKRTLQRYRSLGVLPYQFIYHKIFYKEPDVEEFIKSHFNKSEKNRENVHGDEDIAEDPGLTNNEVEDTGCEPDIDPDGK